MPEHRDVTLKTAMPGRSIPLITGQTYHVFNRGINHQETFFNPREYRRAVETLKYYHLYPQPTSLSRYLELADDKRSVFGQTSKSKLVDIYAYCLMPNHFHLLVRQNIDSGISKLIGNFQNSYTKYLNSRQSRDGSLFLDQFKAVLINTEEELIHVNRYIHLNPYTSFLVEHSQEVFNYRWSSAQNYLSPVVSFIDTSIAINILGGVEKWKQFILDQADYQRYLSYITKHTDLESTPRCRHI